MHPAFSFNTFLVATTFLLTCAEGKTQSVDELIARGDVFDLKFQPAEALKYYLPAEKLEPQNVTLLVLCATRGTTAI